MTNTRAQPSQAPEMTPAHVVAKLNFAQALIYLNASKRLLDSVGTRTDFHTGDDGIAYAGDAIMGLVALDLGLNAVRWAVANCPPAEIRFPHSGLAEMTGFWARINPLRNYLVHFDQRIAESLLMSIGIDSTGIQAGGGHSVAFEEWRRWLAIMQPWVLSECLLPAIPTTDQARPPDWVPIPTAASLHVGEAQLPPPGAVWFGTGLVQADAHVLEGRGLRFPPGARIFLTARFIRETPADVRLQVTAPDHTTYVVQSFRTSVSANVVSMELSGATSEGRYVVALLDETDEALATGHFEILRTST